MCVCACTCVRVCARVWVWVRRARCCSAPVPPAAWLNEGKKIVNGIDVAANDVALFVLLLKMSYSEGRSVPFIFWVSFITL